MTGVQEVLSGQDTPQSVDLLLRLLGSAAGGNDVTAALPELMQVSLWQSGTQSHFVNPRGQCPRCCGCGWVAPSGDRHCAIPHGALTRLLASAGHLWPVRRQCASAQTCIRSVQTCRAHGRGLPEVGRSCQGAQKVIIGNSYQWPKSLEGCALVVLALTWESGAQLQSDVSSSDPETVASALRFIPSLPPARLAGMLQLGERRQCKASCMHA